MRSGVRRTELAADSHILGAVEYVAPCGFPFRLRFSECSDGRLLAGNPADRLLGTDQVGLPVIEVNGTSDPNPGGHPLWVFSWGQHNPDSLFAKSADLSAHPAIVCKRSQTIFTASSRALGVTPFLPVPTGRQVRVKELWAR